MFEDLQHTAATHQQLVIRGDVRLRTSTDWLPQSFKKEMNEILVVVKLKSHAIMDLIVLQSDVVLVHRVPLLNSNFVRPGTCKFARI